MKDIKTFLKGLFYLFVKLPIGLIILIPLALFVFIMEIGERQ